MTDEEYRRWFAGLNRQEQLAHAHELRKDFAEQAAVDGEGGDDLLEMDDAIAFVELASHFERGSIIDDVTRVPALDAIEMMWDWVCDICEDDFRKAREMSIEIETTKRWARLLNALYLRAVEHEGPKRSQGRTVSRRWRSGHTQVQGPRSPLDLLLDAPDQN